MGAFVKQQQFLVCEEPMTDTERIDRLERRVTDLTAQVLVLLGRIAALEALPLNKPATPGYKRMVQQMYPVPVVDLVMTHTTNAPVPPYPKMTTANVVAG